MTSEYKGITNDQAAFAALGVFDGVHTGHRAVIEKVKEEAAMRNLSSAVISFRTHPQQVLHPEIPFRMLTSPEERAELLRKTGIDRTIFLDFTPEMSLLSAYDFLKILSNRYCIKGLIIGYDHRFGHNRSEGFEDYVHYGRELGMEVLLARAYSYSKETSVTEVTVSSSAIRGLLQEGNVSEAAEYLGYDFFLDGTVVGGYQVGRKIGFPTANLRVSDSDKLIPCDGVYAVRVCVEGKEYGGMLSIGYRPTLENGPDRSIEVHIFRFDADIYQQPMRLSFVRRTRPELKFDSIEELIAQLHRDEVEIKSILSL